MAGFTPLPQNAFGQTNVFTPSPGLQAPSVFTQPSSTPQTSGNLLPGFPTLSNALAGNVLLPNDKRVNPTSTGGVTIPTSHVAAINTPAEVSQAPSGTSLADYITNTNPTGNGGNLTTNANGQPTGYTPSHGYSIDTSKIPSSALSSNYGMSDLASKYGTYQDYVNALVQAQGYSPAYLQAYQGQQQAQANQSAVGSALVSRGVPTTANYLANPQAYSGDTMGYAQAVNGQEQALASQQQTQQNIALNTQQLARTGQISAAQSNLQYNPVAVSGENAINQYNSLQQQFPGAGIPAYNPTLSPAQNQQIANAMVAQSPAYQAGFQSTYTQPGGGTGIYSKLNLNGLQQNNDGTYTLVPGAAAALGSANANIVNNSLSNLSTINAAIQSSTKTLSTTQQFMNQYGLNESNVPIVTQIQNQIKDQTTQRGAIAGLNADLNTLRSDYSQFLIGRGGSVAGTGPNSPEVLQAIPDNISSSQLQILVGQMQQDGQNTADAVSQQVNQALQGISTNSVQSSSQSPGTSGGWASLGD